MKRKRKLNLNQIGMVFIKLIGMFGLVIPAVLYLVNKRISQGETIRSILLGGVKVSLAIGVSLLFVFCVLVVLEQIQDYVYDKQYRKARNQKLPLANGYYECQFCGNQKLKEDDKTCYICGEELM